MRIEIKHGVTTTGILKKTKFFTIEISVALSEEEKFMIKDQQIEEIMVMERQPPHSMGKTDADWAIRFEHLLSGKIAQTNFVTSVMAKNHAVAVLENFRKAKEFMIDNSKIGETIVAEF